jgi:hypothetical protein
VRPRCTDKEVVVPNYKRIFVPGGTYFFTLVTFDRMPLFDEPDWGQVEPACVRDLVPTVE